MTKHKIYAGIGEALAGVTFDGMTIMSGGFGLSGNPERLIDGLLRGGVRDLTVISNNCGADGFGLWKLLNNGQIRKMVSSYIGENKLFAELYLSGKLELELNPQGTLAERIRAGGAGIPAFYTRTGVGTVVAEGKPVDVFDGEEFVRETWLRADLAIVKAWRADPQGNLVYRKTARNFNPNMATAGKVTIAEVEEIVPAGTLDPDHVHTPGIYVDRIVQGDFYEKRIEFLTTRPRPEIDPERSRPDDPCSVSAPSRYKTKRLWTSKAVLERDRIARPLDPLNEYGLLPPRNLACSALLLGVAG